MFDKIGHCLEDFSLSRSLESVSSYIIEKLPILESLELDFTLSNDTKDMISIPQLKSLKIGCHAEINFILRILSDNGIIENLIIYGGFFKSDALKLNLNKLQSFEWMRDSGKSSGISNILKSLTRAEMSAFKSIKLYGVATNDINVLLNFLESKKTVNNVSITVNMRDEKDLIPFSDWYRLIEILQEPCTPKRPILNFQIIGIPLKKEEVSKILCDGQ